MAIKKIPLDYDSEAQIANLTSKLNEVVDIVNRRDTLGRRKSSLQMQAAKDLWATNNYSMREIAFIVGYKNASSIKWLLDKEKRSEDRA